MAGTNPANVTFYMYFYFILFYFAHSIHKQVSGQPQQAEQLTGE